MLRQPTRNNARFFRSTFSIGCSTPKILQRGSGRRVLQFCSGRYFYLIRNRVEIRSFKFFTILLLVFRELWKELTPSWFSSTRKHRSTYVSFHGKRSHFVRHSFRATAIFVKNSRTISRFGSISILIQKTLLFPTPLTENLLSIRP